MLSFLIKREGCCLQSLLKEGTIDLWFANSLSPGVWEFLASSFLWQKGTQGKGFIPPWNGKAEGDNAPFSKHLLN